MLPSWRATWSRRSTENTYGLKVGIFRAWLLTGPAHSGVELHGFISYLIQVALDGGTYNIFGYKGKQVRDQIP